MYIEKAFCIELGRSIDIAEAKIAYFSELDADKRARFHFTCSSPECQALDNPVTIVGVNYDKVLQDEAGFLEPHYRSQSLDGHAEDCQWVIEEEARREYVSDSRSASERKKRKKTAASDGYIAVSTFLQTLADVDNKESSPDDDKVGATDKENARRRRRVQTAKKRIAGGRQSASFTQLVTNYLGVRREAAWKTPLNVEGIGESTYGQLFRKLDWYDDKVADRHIYYGAVRVTRLYPKDHDFKEGALRGVELKFLQKLTLGETTGFPTLYLTAKDFESIPSAHVLAESIKLAVTDKGYKDILWCHFYGRVVAESVEVTKTDTRDAYSFVTLKVKLENIAAVELIPQETDAKSGRKMSAEPKD